MFFYEDWGWKIRVWWKTKVEIELTNGPKNNNCFESKVNSMLVLEWKEYITASSVSRDKPRILTCPFQCTSCPISWKWPVCKSFARHDGRVRPCYWDISTYVHPRKLTWKPRTTMKGAIFSKPDLKYGSTDLHWISRPLWMGAIAEISICVMGDKINQGDLHHHLSMFIYVPGGILTLTLILWIPLKARYQDMLRKAS